MITIASCNFSREFDLNKIINVGLKALLFGIRCFSRFSSFFLTTLFLFQWIIPTVNNSVKTLRVGKVKFQATFSQIYHFCVANRFKFFSNLIL